MIPRRAIGEACNQGARRVVLTVIGLRPALPPVRSCAMIGQPLCGGGDHGRSQRSWRVANPLAQPEASPPASPDVSAWKTVPPGCPHRLLPETYIPVARVSPRAAPPIRPRWNGPWSRCRPCAAALAPPPSWAWVGERRGLENRLRGGPAGELLGYRPEPDHPGGEENYVPDGKHSLFTVDGVTFGIVVCHEGWRYPETVRWATTRGAQVIFQPQQTVGRRNANP